MRESIIERAFSLARTGECQTVQDIRRRLSREGFEATDAHLSGKLIREQLSAIIAQRPELA
ncbi:MAG: hypothetical protein ACT4OE_04410 [Sphingosinicella sp.]